MVESLATLDWGDYLAIFLITFFGLPHGAFDAAVGISIGFYNDNNRSSNNLATGCASKFVLMMVRWNEPRHVVNDDLYFLQVVQQHALEFELQSSMGQLVAHSLLWSAQLAF